MLMKIRRRHRSPAVIARAASLRVLSVLVLAIGLCTVVAAETSTAASAARCKTAAHVYINGGYIKYETDPIDGPIADFTVRNGQTYNVGGNGITPSEDPFWAFYRVSDGAHVSTIIGNRTGGNCVSNQKTFISTLTPDTYIMRAYYYGGNSGVTISGQAQLRMIVLPALNTTARQSGAANLDNDASR
ncbi:hypothetical protein [Nonomuraea sp. NEAU-A123]|uniref:hypothetical protein n=1 Tax=Nonomuraea sp. NEAU-A123 TaxID=2839649 RepID=UPI001BE40030|nr:hypothetical protein [Nonomuraea sp. NEAU-A123]MBT2235350.1 hypothetical protein [Nonomuraea sp. NEAU-A123]